MSWIGNHTPWRILGFLRKHFPSAYQRLRYGTPNLNTEEHWDDAWKRHGIQGFRATGEAQTLRERVVQTVPQGAAVLDVGCGVGETMILLRDQRDCQCSGLDIAPSAISGVLSKGMTAKLATLPNIPYPDGAFDVVVCTETLEHVSDAAGTLREVHRVLKPEGLLIMSVPDGRLDEEDSHVHRFTDASLRRLLDRRYTLLSLESLDSKESDVAPSLFVVARSRAR
jgi:ubiquinone/menaquinone biosynthesis C-methylase UbiE